jgi:hypothetical protein
VPRKRARQRRELRLREEPPLDHLAPDRPDERQQVLAVVGSRRVSSAMYSTSTSTSPAARNSAGSRCPISGSSPFACQTSRNALTNKSHAGRGGSPRMLRNRGALRYAAIH